MAISEVAPVVVNDSDCDLVSDVSAGGNDDDVVSGDSDDVDAEELVSSGDVVSEDAEVDADERILEAKLMLGEDSVPVNESIRSHS